MRVLLVSQMYPGTAAPELGVFVQGLERELERRGHVFARAVVDHPGGKGRHAVLLRDVVRTARRFKPDVVYAHFLVPAGLFGALAGRAPLVVTAHGQDVRNAAASRAVRAATRLTIARAKSVVAVSGWLRDQLVDVIPAAAAKTSVIDCGVDLARFAPQDAASARATVGWQPEGTAFVCIGSLSERKNVLGLARAFAKRGEGSLAFVGAGPLRDALEGQRNVHLAGRVGHDEVPQWFAAADVVCQPSLIEPFGLSTLEGMASARSVVATRVGGPPEFVPPEAGVLVTPGHDRELIAALDAAAKLPRPNLAARAAAAAHDVAIQAARIETLLKDAVGAP
jgi:glycosyltransferase involved in cell wall biosynthesis